MKPYFIIVCTFGAGSSLMLRMCVEDALKSLGYKDFQAEVCDMGTCKGKNPTAYLCSIVLEANLKSQDPGAPVIGIKNFYSENEVIAAIKPLLEAAQD